MKLKVKMRQQGISIYKIVSLNAKKETKKWKCVAKWIENRLNRKVKELSVKDREKLIGYFEKAGVRNLIEDDDFTKITTITYKLK